MDKARRLYFSKQQYCKSTLFFDLCKKKNYFCETYVTENTNRLDVFGRPEPSVFAHR